MRGPPAASPSAGLSGEARVTQRLGPSSDGAPSLGRAPLRLLALGSPLGSVSTFDTPTPAFIHPSTPRTAPLPLPRSPPSVPLVLLPKEGSRYPHHPRPPSVPSSLVPHPGGRPRPRPPASLRVSGAWIPQGRGTQELPSFSSSTSVPWRIAAELGGQEQEEGKGTSGGYLSPSNPLSRQK